ncbi:WXG100 family type VII secretion target [Nocardia vaccinii]|uniref:WXG100 family type VII secretion target n=1 Tax=Nocardia vaccinii TaxID=1822 RepID=UPI00082AB0B0|nr:WXG100 family type VII secretion target [Nocardia vaccinii]
MSASRIAINHGQVADTVAQVKKIIANMDNNTKNLHDTSQSLMDAFEGAGGTGYQEIAGQLKSKLDAYGSSLTRLNAAVGMAHNNITDLDINIGHSFQH